VHWWCFELSALKVFDFTTICLLTIEPTPCTCPFPKSTVLHCQIVVLGNGVPKVIIVLVITFECAGKQYERGDIDGSWRHLLLESRQKAEADIETLLDAIKTEGWLTKDILLGPQEKCSFSILGH
jgi:hypothetical protein